MQTGFKAAIIVCLLLLGGFLIVRKTGVLDSQKERIERELMKPVPLDSGWTVNPVWDKKIWTGDRCNAIALDRKNQLLALVQVEDSRNDSIMKTVFRYQDIRRVDLVVDGEAVGGFSHTGQSGEMDKPIEGNVLKGIQKKMPVLQPVADEESIHDIHLAVHATDGRMARLSFGLQDLDLARRWYSLLWQATAVLSRN